MWKVFPISLALVLTTTVTRAQHTPDTAIVENGRGLFAAYCASCHGALAGVIAQEVIDVAAVLNALRAAIPPKDPDRFLKAVISC